MDDLCSTVVEIKALCRACNATHVLNTERVP